MRSGNLNLLIKQIWLSLASLRIPSVLEPSHLYRTDKKTSDGLKLAPPKTGRQFLWDVTVVKSFGPARLEWGSVANPVTAAAVAEKLKTTKYRKVTEKSYLFQLIALRSKEPPVSSPKDACNLVCDVQNEPRHDAFIKERTSTIQNSNVNFWQYFLFFYLSVLSWPLQWHD